MCMCMRIRIRILLTAFIYLSTTMHNYYQFFRLLCRVVENHPDA